MNRLRTLIFALGVALSIGLAIPGSAYAAGSVIAVQCADSPDSAVCQGQDAKPSSLINKIVNVLLYVLGSIAVVMIIVGGLMYTTSAGDSGKVTQAKNTIMYSIIGLVVAFIAFGVVQFIFVKFTT